MSHGGKDRTDPSAFREAFRVRLKETHHNRLNNFHCRQNIPRPPGHCHPAKPLPN